MRTVLVLLFTSAILVAAPQPGDPGTPEYATATDLVKQLASPRYAVREAAAKKLIEMGGAAAAALREGQKSADEEVRARSVTLLPKAIALDWQRKADAYLADPESKQKHELPLLHAYEKLVAKPDDGTRKLFAAMVKSNGPLFETAATDPKAAPKAVDERARLMLETYRTGNQQVKADPAEIAAILFVQSQTGGPSPTTGRFGQTPFPALLLSNPAVGEAIINKDLGPAFRRLLVRWAETLPATDTGSRRSFCLLARKHPIPEAVPELARMAKDIRADVLSVRTLAIEGLGKAEGTVASTALEDLLVDKSNVLNFGANRESNTLGDLALAMLIKMNKKNLADYGLQNVSNIGFGFGDGEIVTLNIYNFASEDARKKAIQKWKDERPKGKSEVPKGDVAPPNPK